MTELITHLQPLLKELPFAAPPALADKLALHFDLLTEANAAFNLTAITDAETAAVKHYWDCLAMAPLLEKLPAGAAVADIGSGGGFPGLVLAAALPQHSFTLIEATGKKCAFLADAAAAMGLTNVKVETLRAEEAGRAAHLRAAFDAVTARAVAALNVLAEYALPLLKVGGTFYAMKGAGYAEELAEAQNAFAVLSAALAAETVFALPGTEDTRAILSISKQAETAEKYPRRPGMPTKRPL